MYVTKCRLLMTRSGQTAHYDADLIFQDGQALAVVEWHDLHTPEASNPSVTVVLELRYLHPVQGWGVVTHMYELPVQDPRPLH